MYCALCAENKSGMNFKKNSREPEISTLRFFSVNLEKKKKVFIGKKVSVPKKTQIIGLNRQIVLVLFEGYIQM